MVDGPVRRVWAASKPHCKYWDRTAKARNEPFIWVIRLNGPKPGLKLVKNWYDINHDKTIWSDLVRWMWSKSNKYKLNWSHKLLKKKTKCQVLHLMVSSKREIMRWSLMLQHPSSHVLSKTRHHEIIADWETAI